METYELFLKDFPEELKLLINLVNNNKSDYRFDQKYDWSLFMDLVIHHRLFPGLIARVDKEDRDYIPSSVLQQLQSWNHSNTLQMLRLSAEAIKVNHLLLNKQVKVLFLKGPHLGNLLYGDLSLRTSSDLDFLVSIDDLDLVEQILNQNGYVKDDYIETLLNDWTWRHHHFTFIHPETETKLEVHWRLNPGPCKEPTFTELWENKQIIDISQNKIYILSNEDLFFFLVTHGARHGWSRLRWLMDINQIIEKSLNWNQVRVQFKKFGYLPVAGHALILSHKLLNTPVKEQMNLLNFNFKKALSLANDALFYIKQMINLHDGPLPEEISRYHKHHLVQLMSPYQKIIFYLSTFFPYPEDAKLIKLPRQLHILYFVLRPFLWVWRKRQKKKLLAQGLKG